VARRCYVEDLCRLPFGWILKRSSPCSRMASMTAKAYGVSYVVLGTGRCSYVCSYVCGESYNARQRVCECV
jgi:hypothetical protein